MTKTQYELAQEYVRNWARPNINTEEENWALGGAFVAGYDSRQLEISALRAALHYCSTDDPMAVDPDDEFDVATANEWKKMTAQKALKGET